MKQIALVSYADERMTISAEKLMQSGMKFGFTSCEYFMPADLDEDFKQRMAPILAQDRGAGWYCWKPWAIKKVMDRLADGNIIMWSDAGSEFIQPIRHLVDAMDEDILFFSNGCRHLDWCKMDLIKYCFPNYGLPGNLGGQITERLNNAKQVQASHVLFMVTENTRLFVAHWLDLAMRHHLVDNSPSAHDNVPTFAEHRWDQSILCCLQIMYGYKLHWFPSTTGFHIKDQHPEDHYPAMFLHHRKRNWEWSNQ